MIADPARHAIEDAHTFVGRSYLAQEVDKRTGRFNNLRVAPELAGLIVDQQIDQGLNGVVVHARRECGTGPRLKLVQDNLSGTSDALSASRMVWPSLVPPGPGESGLTGPLGLISLATEAVEPTPCGGPMSVGEKLIPLMDCNRWPYANQRTSLRSEAATATYCCGQAVKSESLTGRFISARHARVNRGGVLAGVYPYISVRASWSAACK